MCWTFGPSTIHSVSSGTISDTQWLTYSPTITLHVLDEQTRGSILHIALPRDNLVILHQVGHYSDSYPFTQGAKSPCGPSQQVFFFESQVVPKDVCPPSCLHSMEIPAIYLFVTRETRKHHLFCSQGALNPGSLSSAFYGSWQLIVLHTFPGHSSGHLQVQGGLVQAYPNSPGVTETVIVLQPSHAINSASHATSFPSLSTHSEPFAIPCSTPCTSQHCFCMVE